MLREIVIGILAAGILLAGCVADVPADKSTLELTSSPPGAEIYLDNQYRGTTPSTIAGVEPGSHTLEYRLSGYSSWQSVLSVPSGTSNYFAELAAVPVTTRPTPDTGYISTGIPPGVTVRVSRDEMIIGDSIIFSGTCTGCKNIVLTLYGPGFYTDGVVLDTVRIDSINAWTYTWNPGTKLQSGTFTIVVSDAAGTVSDRKEFRAIGNGVVTVIPSSYAASPGDSISFSGRCTTGARNVRLVLYGPDRFSTGVDLGTFSVTADNTWSYRTRLESTMPVGTYTASASDVPKTTSGSSRFTVGYA